MTPKPTDPDGKTLQVTDEMRKAGLEAWYAPANCTADRLENIYTAMQQAQPIHAGPAMEAVMRSAAFKATKHQYDIHADEVEKHVHGEGVTYGLKAHSNEVEQAVEKILKHHMTHGWNKAACEIAALLVSRGEDRLWDALVDAKNRLIAEGYLPDGEVCKNYDAILNRAAFKQSDHG